MLAPLPLSVRLVERLVELQDAHQSEHPDHPRRLCADTRRAAAAQGAAVAVARQGVVHPGEVQQ